MTGWVCFAAMSVLWLSACALSAKWKQAAEGWQRAYQREQELRQEACRYWEDAVTGWRSAYQQVSASAVKQSDLNILERLVDALEAGLPEFQSAEKPLRRPH